MMIETSTMNLFEAVANGKELTKGMEVKLPLFDYKAYIYGFVATQGRALDVDIDMPALGQAKVLSNRVVYESRAFPILTSVQKACEEKYNLYQLHVPHFLSSYYQDSKYGSWRNAYWQAFTGESVESKVTSYGNVKIEGAFGERQAFYYPRENDLYFQSSSKLRGMASSFAVITRRVSKVSDQVIYEVYNPEEVKIEA
ncbi:MAG: hypothetical protein C7K11_06365 [Candidatus Amulumruptor caecigallinarius]|uniref:Uncharacterized protein n=1 Tax=Candidatus Amulumruptor caecigallinarius TaxID=2109911 RepID=A0A4Q0U8F2_9BACT|nr:MAG: hypothetical protein C7K11_06365 [Candidatus Amulumruptor caecigallinarius]HJE38599.1 hypothetical protein [Candidatus Amulumruptor caecigallinarius]